MGGWSVFIFQAQHGLGKHLDTLDADDIVKFQHAGFWQSIISANISLMFLKISIAVNLLRLGSRRWYIWSLRTIICTSFTTEASQVSGAEYKLIQMVLQVTNICFSISGILTFLLYCRPVAGFWDKSLEPTCAPVRVMVRGGLSNTGTYSVDTRCSYKSVCSNILVKFITS